MKPPTAGFPRARLFSEGGTAAHKSRGGQSLAEAGAGGEDAEDDEAEAAAGGSDSARKKSRDTEGEGAEERESAELFHPYICSTATGLEMMRESSPCATRSGQAAARHFPGTVNAGASESMFCQLFCSASPSVYSAGRYNLERPHPAPAVTSALIASIPPPPLGPQHIHPHVHDILQMMHPQISPAQADFAVRAYHRFATTLPDGVTTAGIFNAGGTGLGKTRDVIALLAVRFAADRMIASGRLPPPTAPAYTARLGSAAPCYVRNLGDRKVLWLSPSQELAPPLIADMQTVCLRSGIRPFMAGRMFPIVNLCALPFKPGRRLQDYTHRELGAALTNAAEIDPESLDKYFTEGVVFLT